MMRKRNPGFLKKSCFAALSRRQQFNAEVLDLVKKEIPSIEAPTPVDFWDNVNWYYEMGTVTTDDAAQLLIGIYKPSQKELPQ
jgi:hypothetical protein